MELLIKNYTNFVCPIPIITNYPNWILTLYKRLFIALAKAQLLHKTHNIPCVLNSFIFCQMCEFKISLFRIREYDDWLKMVKIKWLHVNLKALHFIDYGILDLEEREQKIFEIETPVGVSKHRFL